jgi:hypothetical protein
MAGLDMRTMRGALDRLLRLGSHRVTGTGGQPAHGDGHVDDDDPHLKQMLEAIRTARAAAPGLS